MNICLIANKFPILGRATDTGFLWPIARSFVQSGHKVTVIAGRTPIGKYEVIRDGVRAFYLNEKPSPYAHLNFEKAVYEQFCELHNKEKFDLVHSLDASAYLIATHKKDLNVAVTYDVDATQISQIFSILAMAQETLGSVIATGLAVTYKFLTTYFLKDRKILKTADGIFVTSPEQRVFLERYYVYPDFHIYTVPYSAEVNSLDLKRANDDLKEQLKLPEGAQVVVTISDMTDVNELKNLFIGFEKVAVKKQNAHLIVVGTGPKFKEIEFEALNLALGNRVHFVGPLKAKELNDYMSLGDIFVNLSLNTTGYDPTLIEAMAQRKVIIGSEMSSLSHIIEDGVDGFLIRPYDTESLGEIMLNIFTGQISASEIGEKARQKVISQFDLSKMSPALLDAYQKILNNLVH